MFTRNEYISEPFLIRPSGNRHKLVYVMENRYDDCRYLEELLDKNSCTYMLQWQSKFDRNHIETVPPKIVDAFNCIVTAWGSLFNLNSAVSRYQIRNDRVEFLEKCFGDKEQKYKSSYEQNINYAELANLVIASLSSDYPF